MVASRSSIAASSGTSLSYFFSSFFPCLLNLSSNTSMRNKYIVCELIAKKALGLHALPAFLQSYLDDSSEASTMEGSADGLPTTVLIGAVNASAAAFVAERVTISAVD